MNVMPTETAPTPRLLDARDVAGLLKVPFKSVYQLADAGLLPGEVRIGRLRRWRADALAAWLEGGGASWPGGWRKQPAEAGR